MSLLILGGTGEARRLAQVLHGRGLDFTLSLAGATRDPAPAYGRQRVGGFGGAEAFATYLQDQNITRIVDATHPFASRITARSWAVAQQMGIPYVQILRPPWQPRHGDVWHEISAEDQAARFVEPDQVVFLATGRQTLEKYAGLSHAHLICRQIDPPESDFPFPNGRFLIGRPPFSVADEVALFEELQVDWLVVKNAGGAASATKLDAARTLGIPVLMMRRPPPAGCPTLNGVEEALEWLGAG